MPAQLLNGTELADKILLEVAKKTVSQKNKPGLAAILVGEDPTSKLYLKLKKEACEKTGIDFHYYYLDKKCPEKEILTAIDFLNKDPEVTGIIVQLPLPKQFNTDKIISAISPQKDVDGFSKKSKFTSPNALGIVELIKSTDENLIGKKVGILANSEIFSRPFKKLLPKCKVEYLNPKASRFTLQASLSDILIVAIGKPKCIKPSMIKKGAILIDVGINKVNKKTIGDIDPACDKVASFRSPVPGGVGPMTVAMLLQNLVKFLK